MQFRNGVFLITEEDHCPLYNVGEELVVNEAILRLPVAKPTCLVLAHEIITIASEGETYERLDHGEKKKTKFDCGGCTGLIRFEFKKEKGFETLQMKLLAASERKEKIKGVSRFAGLLRTIEIFAPLKDDDLLDLATLMELQDYPWGFPIVQKGDPGVRLYIIVSGRVEIIDDEGLAFGEMEKGDVFGEMSLLSGDPVTTTITAAEPCQLAVMSHKNFRHIISRFPALQVFFYKLLVSRITTINQQRAEELASGMTGQLADISPVELCQMINANQKTGILKLESEDSKASLMFNEGELIHAEIDGRKGKEAFYAVLSLKSGRFKFTQGLTASQKTKDVIGGFMGLVMEGMKRLDDTSQK
jgi:CRP/FNR family transcriptional regulator, cyclic AMP receptor protein